MHYEKNLEAPDDREINSDDMIAEIRLHDITDLPHGEGEGGFLKFGNHHAPDDGAQIPASLRAARVLGMRPGQLGEILAVLQVFLNIFDFIESLRLFHDRGFRGQFDQDMPGPNSFGGGFLDLLHDQARDRAQEHDVRQQVVAEALALLVVAAEHVGHVEDHGTRPDLAIAA